MEREVFDHIFLKGGSVRGIPGYRNELIKKLDLDPTNADIRRELNDTVTVCCGICAMYRLGG